MSGSGHPHVVHFMLRQDRRRAEQRACRGGRSPFGFHDLHFRERRRRPKPPPPAHSVVAVMAAMLRMFGAAFAVLPAMLTAAAMALPMGHCLCGWRRGRNLHGGLGGRDRGRAQQDDHVCSPEISK
jgi:hypothetical protein